MKVMWWKIASILILLYVIIMGFFGNVPDLDILHQTIRNLYFHVCMWFVMFVMLSVSFVNSLLYLSRNKILNDIRAAEGANVGLLFGILGIITGMVWAKYTWGQWWMNDPKLNGAAVGILIFLAYAVLRNSIEDADKKARISAVYNIFGYVMFVLFILVLPKVSNGSIHPGNAPNDVMPIFSVSSSMRFVFYLAVFGWILLGFWIYSLKVRISVLKFYK